MVRWAKRHGMTVTIHTGGPSIAGSNPISAEVVLEADPTWSATSTAARPP
jgi:enamidase